jgi:hypothetical protein
VDSLDVVWRDPDALCTIICVQRLYSMFPTGRPGVALLLLRIGMSVWLFDGAGGPLARLAMPWGLLLLWAIALALWLGFLTPVVMLLYIAIEIGSSMSGAGAPQAMHACTILDAVALSLLGPGAYSLDARLFGRRQIVVSPHEPPDRR